MRNPLLVPELREMLTHERAGELRDFAEANPPNVAAEFVGALTLTEQRDVLRVLGPELGGRIFTHFDGELKLGLLDVLDLEEAVELLGHMEEEDRTSFLEQVSHEQQASLRERLAKADGDVALPLIDEIDEARTAERTEPEDLTAEEIASEVAEHLEAYRIVGGRVEPSPRVERGCWVNVVNPTKDNLPLLAEHFKIPVDFLTSSLDLDETARVEIDDNATLIIFKVPYFDENNVDVLYFTIPIGIILVNGLILTICSKPGSVLQDFIGGKVRNVAPGHRFILQLILRATMLYLQHLKQLNNAANIIQKKLERESRNKQLIKLFNIEKSLVYFTTSLKSNVLMLERLRRLRTLKMDEANEELLEDIFTEAKQAIEMANIYSDILSGMMDAFASVISNNLNIVMRLLTSITIIITLPVLVASFYGMNVQLPLQNHPQAFLMIVGISALACALAVAFFVRKRWLER